MGPLSMDLRKRIVQAYENGEGSHAALAKRFAVSRAVVGKLTLQLRALGTLEPQMHRRGRKPAIAGERRSSSASISAIIPMRRSKNALMP